MAAEVSSQIAIVGMSCRFPGGANNLEKLWESLCEGRSMWSDVPPSRYNSAAFQHPYGGMHGNFSHRGGHFIDQDVSTFDARFFGIPAEEAQAMDPQQRIQLEIAYEALENAGISLDQIRGTKTGVFIAVFSRDYEHMMLKDTSNLAKYHMTGAGQAMASNRISHTFDLKGPSITLDTGCSGSLVALHLACQSLKDGESDLAIVGGANLMLSPDIMIPMSRLSILNQDGKCYAFDSRGSGYGRGEGVAAVVLRRMNDSLPANDPIRAIILNSGVNQNGRTIGTAAPSQDAQVDLIHSTYQSAKIDPSEVGYIEAHGTGTVAGDFTEFKAITKVFGACRETPVFVGSIKSNIGHLEAASGIAGLIKAVLVIEKGCIPPNVNLERAKQGLNAEEWQIKFARNIESLPESISGYRYASVNSFGYGGANAHIILGSVGNCPQSLRKPHSERDTKGILLLGNGEGAQVMRQGSLESETTISCIQSVSPPIWPHEHHMIEDTQMSRQVRLLVMTGKTPESLIIMVENLREWASRYMEKNDTRLNDLAYTLCCRRSVMLWRCSFVVATHRDLIHLPSPEAIRNNHIVKAAKKGKVIFVFTGQGAQHFSMGRELINLNPNSVFTKSLRQSENILLELGAPWRLIDELMKEEPQSRLSETELSQPATTALQIALVDLLATLGVAPSAVIGHSSGEIAAAYCAGILSKTMTLRVSYYRGLLRTKGMLGKNGAMLAVALGQARLLQHIQHIQPNSVCIACINSPSSCTLSGDASTIDELKEMFDRLSISNRKLKVEMAYHSHHMQDAAKEYLAVLHGLESKSPRIHFISSVTATAKDCNFDSAYWVTNLVSPVLFSDALGHLSTLPEIQENTLAFVEIGPHDSLRTPVRQTLAQSNLQTSRHTYLASLLRGKSAVHTILELSGRLFELGFYVDLDAANTLAYNSKEIHRPSNLVLKDLPPYPWDHSKPYWYESRLSKEYRFRQNPYHDLLGLRMISSTSCNLSWRHVIDIDTLPWLQEHIIDNNVIFPGAAYICMAVEALCQTARSRQSSDVFEQFILKDLVFSRTLVIPESPERVEMQLDLQIPHFDHSTNSTGWAGFQIFSFSSDGICMKHCDGHIKADFRTTKEEVEPFEQVAFATLNRHEDLHSFRLTCNQYHTRDDIYNELKVKGNCYGPHFATVQELHTGSSQCLARITIPDITACMPLGFMQPNIIHPTILDALFHPTIHLFHQKWSAGPVIPLSIDHVSIFPNISTLAAPGRDILTTTVLCPTPRTRTATADIRALYQDEQMRVEPTVVVSGLELYGFDTPQLIGSDTRSARNETFNLAWNIDANFITSESLQSLKPAFNLPAMALSPEQHNSLSDRVVVVYIQRCLDELENQWIEIFDSHQHHLVRWMREYATSDVYQEIVYSLIQPSPAILEQQLASLGVEGEAISQIGQNMMSILMGSVDPLQLLLEGGLLHRLYAEEPFSRKCISHLVNYVNLLAFKSPSMTVLEVGAGTGATTLPLLRALRMGESHLLERYDFTDISTGFFDSSRSVLEEWSDLLNYRSLNIENDPVSQGFLEGSYDLVIASNVLHATANIETSLVNIRKLLKPGGRLAIIEGVRSVPILNFTFGTLSGWWRGVSEGRSMSPLLSVEKWQESLLQASYSGVDISANDFDGPANRFSLIVSSSIQRNVSGSLKPVKLLYSSPHVDCQKLTQSLQTSLEVIGVQTSLSSWPSSGDDTESIYIILDSAEHPILLEASETDFKQVITLVNRCTKVLWITIQQDVKAALTPERGLIAGFARVARSENQNIKLVTLDVQNHDVSDDEKLASTIRQIILASFGDGRNNYSVTSAESEFVYRNNHVLIPRLLPDLVPKSLFTASSHIPIPEINQFHQANKSLKLEVKNPGLIDSIIFVENERNADAIGQNEVQIQVRACGVNFKDVFVALGQMKHYSTMVGECAGIVTAVGSNCRFQIGDRVCCWNATPYANQARVSDQNVHQIPPSMSFITAASLPVVFMTAYYSLVEVARLRGYQSVLIRAASGGVGQAAVMIAQYLKAEIFVTVGSVEKLQLLHEEYGIPKSHIFSSKSNKLKKSIMHVTKGKGLDVVLNSASGEALHDTWDCIANFGTFVEIGKTDIHRKTRLAMEPFDRNVTFASVDLLLLSEHRPDILQTVFAKIMSLVSTGIVKAVHPIQVLPIREIQQAFRNIQTRKHTGKIVLEAELDATVKSISRPPAKLQLDGSATYLIAGGLGSIGANIARFMTSHGAKNLLILSRRRMSSDAKVALEQVYAKQGVVLRVETCDIADEGQVQKVADYCQTVMPPVKGVIQAAMVLRDCSLEEMTISDFQAALRPKVQGTRSLNTVFQDANLDFFVMLSSLAGIRGSQMQANYAAGNSFQDALAHSKAGNKTTYVSLSLGMIEDSDIISKHPHIEQNLKSQGYTTITTEELLTLLEYSLSAQVRQDGRNHVIIGISRKFLSSTQDEDLLKNPIFNHLTNANEAPLTAKTSKPRTIAEEITNLNCFEDVSDVVTGAITQHLCSLLAVESDAIHLRSPVASLGLDSLVTVEFKNWIVRTFHARLQTSEIQDASSVIALSLTILQRSTIVANFRRLREHNIPESTDSENRTNPCTTPPMPKIPIQPLPELGDTLDFFLYSVRALCSSEEVKQTEIAISDFLKHDGLGQTLQRRLQERASSPERQDWLFDLYADHMYRKQRAPVNPFTVFFGSHMSTLEVQHSQAERAALLCHAALKFKERLETGKLTYDVRNDQPQCMYTLEWLFGTSRIPSKEADKIARVQYSDHIIVLRYGHVFEIPLSIGRESMDYGSLKSIFHQILSRDIRRLPSVTTLTADKRDSWASIRETVINADVANKSLIDMIEASAFVICLDDSRPESPTERYKQFLYGDISNRWSDKTLTFVVCGNGASAYVCEHSQIDGGALEQLNRHIQESINTHKPDAICNTIEDSHYTTSVPEYTFVLTPEIEAHIDRVQQQWQAVVVSSPVECHYYSCKILGSTFLRSHQCAPKSSYQIIIQLASMLFFGYLPPSYETVSMRSFRHGRVEKVQAVLPSVATFCSNALDENVTTSKRREMFLEAVRSFTFAVTRVSRGQGFVNHLYALQEMRREGEELPSLFNESSAYVKIMPCKIMTDCLEWLDVISDAGFMMPDPEYIWVHYEVEPERCRFYIKAPEGRIGAFFHALEQAAGVVRELLDRS